MKKSALSLHPDLTRKIAQKLTNTPYFSSVTEDLLFDVLTSANLYEMEADFKLIHQGDEADRIVYILIDGRCDVFTDGQFILSIDRPGMTIGEMAVITPNASRSADIIAKESSSVIGISVGFLEDKTPDAQKKSNTFLKMFSNILSEKLRITTDRAKLYEDSVLETQEINKYNKEITDQSADLKKELQSKLAQIKLYSQVVETNQDAIVIADSKGELQSWNQAFSTLFGYSKKETKDLKIEDLIVDLGFDDFDWSEQFYDGWEGHKLALRVDKSKFPAQITISPVRTKQGKGEEKVVFAAVVRDITMQREYEENILKANEELKVTYQELESTLKKLEESNQIKDKFLSNISSQLKTPLISLINYSELMAKEFENKVAVGESRSFLSQIINEGRKMDQMVGNLLSLAELSKGLTTMNLKVVQIKDLIHGVKTKLGDTTNLLFDVDPKVTTIIADESKIIEALCDIANYINQRQEEGQTISIRLSLNQELQYLETEIVSGQIDNNALFTESEFLADDIELNMQKGELLIPVAKRIVEMHQGEMIFKTKGDADTILLHFPIDPGKNSGVRIKVVIIDDHEWDRKLLRGIIEKQYQISEIFEFESQIKALNALNAIKPNIVIVDPFFSNPKWRFEEFIKKILHGNSDNVSTLVVSEQLSDINTRNHIISKGITDFLFKPFTVDDALFKIKSIIDIKQKFNQLSDSVQKAELNAATDGMTGLYNRKYYDNFMKQNLLESGLKNSKLSLIMSDVDNFKIYNDTNGHQLGDEVLKQVANILKTFVRDTDMTARYGGEEFVVVLPGTTKQMAMQVAEKLRKTIDEETFVNEKTQPLGRLTASFGVATYPENGDTAENILKVADQCLYLAKEKGRNTVVAAEGAFKLKTE
ncbi:MAG: diguanylate cyclase [Proteobacteria bacterium]|nr:diguanylate cyclase [Pseudomonadota bacterium]